MTIPSRRSRLPPPLDGGRKIVAEPTADHDNLSVHESLMDRFESGEYGTG
jgi:hypothetical protein